MKTFLLALCVLAAFSTFSQTTPSQQPPPAAHDSVRKTTDTVLIWYVNDVYQGTSTTGMALRIMTSKLDFIQPTQNDLQKDSFTVKKQWVPTGTAYYIPVTIVDSVILRKHKGKMTQDALKIAYAPLPPDLLLYDFNRNFNALLPKKTTTPQNKK